MERTLENKLQSLPPLCRCCMEPVDVFWQSHLSTPGGNFYVHCKSSDCALYYATRELVDWLTMDLSNWNAAQHPQWVAPENLLQMTGQVA